jgi:hypothetical protein
MPRPYFEAPCCLTDVIFGAIYELRAGIISVLVNVKDIAYSEFSCQPVCRDFAGYCIWGATGLFLVRIFAARVRDKVRHWHTPATGEEMVMFHDPIA